jgi:hypothetical protein
MLDKVSEPILGTVKPDVDLGGDTLHEFAPLTVDAIKVIEVFNALLANVS